MPPSNSTERADGELRKIALVREAYRNQAGVIVPSVTEILETLAKPWLVKWAWKLGLEKIHYATYSSSLAEVGTLVHQSCMGLLADGKLPAIEADPAIRSLADSSILKFMAWYERRKIKPILIEKRLVSEKYQYGGQEDIFALIDGIPEILEIKTSDSIHEEHRIQGAAYGKLIEEQGGNIPRPEGVRILSLPRTDKESFDESVKRNTSAEWMIFWHLLNIHKLRKREEKS